MSCSKQQAVSESSVVVALSFLPDFKEQMSYELLSTIEGLRIDVFAELSTSSEYTVQVANDDTRSGEIIWIFLNEALQQALANKELILASFKAAAAAIEVIVKSKRVKKIELKIDADSIIIEDVDHITAQRLIDIFETKHPRKIIALSTSSPLQISSTVSIAEEAEEK